VSRHPHEIGEVRQIVRQRCPGKDVPQVELVALHRVEIADKAGAGAHRHVDVAPARAGCGPAGPLGGTAGDVEDRAAPARSCSPNSVFGSIAAVSRCSWWPPPGASPAPVAPDGAAAPVAPNGAAAPVAPAWPVVPAVPVAPVMPAAPVAPAAPVVPVEGAGVAGGAG